MQSHAKSLYVCRLIYFSCIIPVLQTRRRRKREVTCSKIHRKRNWHSGSSMYSSKRLCVPSAKSFFDGSDSKNMPSMQETWVWSLEKGMATHSVFLPDEFHGQRSLAGYSSCVAKSRTQLSEYHFLQIVKLHHMQFSYLGGQREEKQRENNNLNV